MAEPLTMGLIMGLGGLAKDALIDQPARARQNRLEALKTELSGYSSKIRPGQYTEESGADDFMQFGLAGASLAQNINESKATESLLKAKAALNESYANNLNQVSAMRQGAQASSPAAAPGANVKLSPLLDFSGKQNLLPGMSPGRPVPPPPPNVTPGMAQNIQNFGGGASSNMGQMSLQSLIGGPRQNMSRAVMSRY